MGGEMPTRKSTVPFETMDDLLASLGGISPRRVRLRPPPGRATAGAWIRLRDRERRLYELVDGTIVEKVMGAKESLAGIQLAALLGDGNRRAGNRGMLLGADGTLQR